MYREPEAKFSGGQLCKERLRRGNPRVGSWTSGGYDVRWVRAEESFGLIQSLARSVSFDDSTPRPVFGLISTFLRGLAKILYATIYQLPLLSYA